ncbi:lanthionine synthetase LanC family protein [Kribbella sp. NPDC004536]|uniref:lanthionine synthetase LanC family protein n=1 Tax=Kribbella sp. NPDC004536 TaxID=3364106 RepID=UPI0036A3FD3F
MERHPAAERAAMTYGELAETSWSWVLGQVRWDGSGPWIPVSGDGGEPDEYVDGMHSGIGGLAYVLAEIRLIREWTAAERELAAAIGDRLRSAIPSTTSTTFFDGLVSSIGVLTALDQPGTSACLDRLQELETENGWPESFLDEPRYAPGAVANDITLGTGAVLLGMLWVCRHSTHPDRAAGRAAQQPPVPPAPDRPTGQTATTAPDGLAGQTATTAPDRLAGREASAGQRLAVRAVELLLGAREVVPGGVNWQFVSRRFREDEPTEMPNFSHGLAGIVAVLAVAGVELGRPELVDVARRGAEHLVTLGITDDRGFRVPRVIPWAERHGDEYTYNWCHGGAGTALAFSALEHADVPAIAGESPTTWRRRCLDGMRYSGIPERLHPGFWDNDGRCCGTAGVGDAFLDAWLRDGDQADLEFAVLMGDTLVEHAYPDGYWRFLEHKNEDPLLPPGVGWMQGTAGISAYLFRLQRMLDGDQRTVERMDNWWALRR